MTLEYWEDLFCKLNEMRRYRRIVGSLAGSCLSAAIPLLSSNKETACLVALDIVEVFLSVRTMPFNKLK
jgi:TELO2-interacting protein 1